MSSGDLFPDRYFPAKYFPERYFQGGQADPNAMSASLSASSSLVGSLGYIDHNQTVIEAPTVSTGGGGAAHWYRGKYRGELRRAIKSAISSLEGVKDRRKRKKIVRKIAETIRPQFDFWPVFPEAVRVELAPLEALRIQLVRLTFEIKAAEDRAKTDQMQELLQKYEDHVKRIEQQEEEAVAAILLLAA